MLLATSYLALRKSGVSGKVLAISFLAFSFIAKILPNSKFIFFEFLNIEIILNFFFYIIKLKRIFFWIII